MQGELCSFCGGGAYAFRSDKSMVRSISRRRPTAIEKCGESSSGTGSDLKLGWGFESDKSATTSLTATPRTGPARSERRVATVFGPERVTGSSQQVSSYCWANGYRVSSLARHLSDDRGLLVESFQGVLHVRDIRNPRVDVFIFPFGAVIIWGIDRPELEQAILEAVRTFESGKLLTGQEFDGFRFVEGNPTFRVNNDVIYMLHGPAGEEGERTKERLAVSYALAQSVKLITFEEAIQEILRETKHFPEQLAKTGAISNSRRDVARKLGRLLQTRHEVYLHADMMSTPEFFWDFASFEPPYLSMERYLELKSRADMVNKRVEVVRELFDLLSHELQFKHSSDLEVIIIVLIAIEIGISLLKDAVSILYAQRMFTLRAGAIGFIGLVLGISISFVAIMSSRLIRRKDR